MDLGVVGINSRAVAASAKRLGFTVHLVDYFRDLDVEADFCYPMQKNPYKPDLGVGYSPDGMVEYAVEKLAGIVDGLVVTSDIGCSPDLVRRLEKDFHLLGNNSKEVARAKDWGRIEKILRRCDIKCPKTKIIGSVSELNKSVLEMGFPVVVKPLIECVGIAPALIEDLQKLESWNEINGMSLGGKVLVQEFIQGEAVSSSLLCNREYTQALSANKQLIGLPEFGAMGFNYCGNIVPLGSELDDLIKEKSARLLSELKLKGSNGVDFILARDSLYFMEINTRFQDTFESVEGYCQINLLEEHLQALEGNIKAGNTGGRGLNRFGKGILYARNDVVAGDLAGIKDIGDIPRPGSVILEGEPLCSIYAKGRDVLSSLKEKAKEVEKQVRKTSQQDSRAVGI